MIISSSGISLVGYQSIICLTGPSNFATLYDVFLRIRVSVFLRSRVSVFLRICVSVFLRICVSVFLRIRVSAILRHLQNPPQNPCLKAPTFLKGGGTNPHFCDLFSPQKVVRQNCGSIGSSAQKKILVGNYYAFPLDSIVHDLRVGGIRFRGLRRRRHSRFPGRVARVYRHSPETASPRRRRRQISTGKAHFWTKRGVDNLAMIYRFVFAS